MISTYRETHLSNVDAGAWNELACQNSVHTIYQTYEWHKGLWNTYQRTHELYLICVNDHDHLIGISPLMLKNVNGLRTLFFIGHDRADYSDFLYSNGNINVLNAIWEFLKNDVSSWDKIELLNIPEHSPSGPILESLSKQHNWIIQFEKCADCSSWMSQKPDDMQTIIEKKSLRRHLKYYLNLPDYQVQHLKSKADILPLLDTYFQQHIKRRYVTGTPSLFLDPFVCDTYRSLVEAFDQTGWLILTVIRSQERIIAFHFGYNYNKKFIWYKPSFDITEFKHSPGEVLLRELLEYAASTDCLEFDFTTGQEPFKERFSNSFSRNFMYEIYHDRQQVPKAVSSFSPLTRVLRRAKIIIQKHGFIHGLCQIWKIFLEKNFAMDSVYLYRLAADIKPPDEIKPHLEEFTWRQADVNDILQLDYFKNINEKLEYFQSAFKRLSQGDQFWIVENQEGIISFAWCAKRDTTSIGEIDTEIYFEKPALVIYDCRTLPGYQKKSLYKYMLTRLIEEHLSIEKIIYCKKDNLPSRKGIEGIFQFKKQMNYARFFRLKLRWSIQHA